MENSKLFKTLNQNQKLNLKNNINNYFPHPDFTIIFQIFKNYNTIKSIPKKYSELFSEYINN